MRFIVQPQRSSLAAGPMAFAAVLPRVVTIYEHANYGGKSQDLAPGRYDIGALAIGNDRLSSLRVPRGFRVTLFEHANFQGRQKVFRNDAPWVGDDFNDITSGVVVEVVPVATHATIYEHANYGGKKQDLAPGRYDMGELSIGNDRLSSLKVPAGLRVTLFEHASFKGRTKSFTGDAPWVGDDFNDITSGVAVEQISQTDEVTVYQHNNYEGRSQSLPIGRYDMGQLTIGNDVMSSLRVPEGMVAVLYEHANFKGRVKIVTGDTPALPDFNDVVSSIVVQLAATIYEHAHFQGRRQVLPMGRYDINQLTIGNDRLSSLKVPAGLIVTLYEHANFRGKTRTFLHDSEWIGDAFNDRTSSILVTRNEVEVPDKALWFGDKINLRSHHGRYLVAEADGNLNANRERAQSWEQFEIVRSGPTRHECLLSFGDVISLRSCHGKYVVAEANGEANANRGAIGDWERFVVIRSGLTAHQSFVSHGDVISLRSCHGRYVVAEADGRARADRGAIGDWERWRILSRTGPHAVTTVEIGEAADSDTGGCPAGVCGSDSCGQAACVAAVAGAATCETFACAGALCGADAAGIAGCVLDACGTAACRVAVGAANGCLAAACGGDGCAAAACALATCGGNLCAGAACGADVCGTAACVGDAAVASACGIQADLANACAADASGVSACPADACAANVCGINLCPADACAADACALDVIPIIPGI
ncbi:MAG: beta/gamma crystallin-related protein [Pseudomonadota bacterium]